MKYGNVSTTSKYVLQPSLGIQIWCIEPSLVENLGRMVAHPLTLEPGTMAGSRSEQKETYIIWVKGCNILIRSHFPVHISAIHKWNICLCTLLGCTVHHFRMYCTTYGVYRNGQVFTFACVGWWWECYIGILCTMCRIRENIKSVCGRTLFVCWGLTHKRIKVEKNAWTNTCDANQYF